MPFIIESSAILDPSFRLPSWGNQSFYLGLGSMVLRSHASVSESQRIAGSGGQSLGLGLTVGSTRTPPALPSALSQLLAISASFSASAQAVPVNLVR